MGDPNVQTPLCYCFIGLTKLWSAFHGQDVRRTTIGLYKALEGCHNILCAVPPEQVGLDEAGCMVYNDNESALSAFL